MASQPVKIKLSCDGVIRRFATTSYDAMHETVARLCGAPCDVYHGETLLCPDTFASAVSTLTGMQALVIRAVRQPVSPSSLAQTPPQQPAPPPPQPPQAARETQQQRLEWMKHSMGEELLDTPAPQAAARRKTPAAKHTEDWDSSSSSSASTEPPSAAPAPAPAAAAAAAPPAPAPAASAPAPTPASEAAPTPALVESQPPSTEREEKFVGIEDSEPSSVAADLRATDLWQLPYGACGSGGPGSVGGGCDDSTCASSVASGPSRVSQGQGSLVRRLAAENASLRRQLQLLLAHQEGGTWCECGGWRQDDDARARTAQQRQRHERRVRSSSDHGQQRPEQWAWYRRGAPLSVPASVASWGSGSTRTNPYEDMSTAPFL
eukprot:Rhum_TRINITY_DN15322_c3_g1::Rhum_TRINITY_DN15322_c3_g1_i1::g.151724::m.151724